MKRRDLIMGLVMLPAFANMTLGQKSRPVKVIKPKRLKKGDTVAMISPSSGVAESDFARALQNISDLGLKTKVGKYAASVNGFLAGTDEQRLEDLHWAFNDKTIDGVWCVRGGYGLSRILPKIDYELIKKNPKVLVGFSDITVLHLAVFQQTGLVTFHGPVGTSANSEYTRKHVSDLLMSSSTNYKIEAAPENIAKGTLAYTTEVISKGRARGQLIGGNLSLLAALAGTPYALRNTKGKILFIEDVGERPYRIDRMFTQLKQSMNMRELSAVALGVFADCEAPDDKSQTVIDVVKDQLGDLGIPVIYGLSFGHIRDQFTLPIGINAELDTEKETITLLENSVI